MKKSLSSLSFAAVLGAAAVVTSVSAADPGAYDFGAFDAPSGGRQFVEVDVPRNLIALASHFVGSDEPEIAALLAGLQRIRVHVIGVEESNRAELSARITKSRDDLVQLGWQRVVSVREDKQSVDVFLKAATGEDIDGIVVTVLNDDEQAVFVNIVGNIKPEQIITIGQRFGIDPLEEIGRHVQNKG